MSFQGNVKGHVFQKQAYPLFLCFILIFLSQADSVCKKLEKLNHKVNYTHTSLFMPVLTDCCDFLEG